MIKENHRVIHSLLLLLCSSPLQGFGAPASTELPSRPSILATAALVNDYYITNNAIEDATWSNATYYTGNQRFYEITGNTAYLDRSVAWGTANSWLRSEKPKYNGNVALNDEDADNHCCGQTFIDLYQVDPQPVRIADITRANDYIVSQSATNYWSWIDTFYMHGPTLAKLSTLTSDSAYSDKLRAMFNDTKVTQNLFDATEGLWYRDNKYIYPAKVTANGNKVFWARGNGWMIAGLCRVIDALPVNAPHRADYIAMVQTMAAALVPLQQPDGFWRSSLYEPTQFDMPETSGTSFYTFAMAWCINNGILDRETYLPVVAKAWNGLVAESVHPDGFLGYVQLVAAEPGPSYYADTKAYGVGAFLLAASELSILADEFGPPVPAQIYLETFDNPTGDAPLGNYGWSVLVTENGNISSYTGQSRAAGVASGDYAFYAAKADDGTPWNDAVPNNPALLSTQLAAPVDITRLTEIAWLASGDNADHGYRAAIEINGVWYASDPALYDGVPDSGTTVTIPLSFGPASFATASNWRAIQNTTVGSPGTLSLGTTPASDLAGEVTAIGLYLVAGTDNEIAGDHVRFDNFQIWALPVQEIPPSITSFTSVGGGTWELMLEGTAGKNYAFYSSPDLTFAPGTLVSTLSQASPSTDPGTVTDGNLLTTDGDGNGLVRMTLTGNPADFVRAQTAP